MALFRTRVVPATDTTGTRVAVTYDGHTQFIGYDHGAPCAQLANQHDAHSSR